MRDYNAEDLSDQEIQRLVDMLAKDPKFANELADAIAARLDEKYGFKQGEIIADIEKLSGQIAGLSSKFDAMAGQFNTLAHNQEMFGGKLELVEKRTERIENLLSKDSGGGLKVLKLERG